MEKTKRRFVEDDVMAQKDIKNKEKVERGKKSRKSGSEFERRVKKDLEEKGWIVIKNPNNVIDGKFTQGKAKWNNFTKSLMMGSGGFPDFIAFKKVQNYVVIERENEARYPTYPISFFNDFSRKAFEIMGVECKTNNYLDKEERIKCKWLLENNIFSKIFIASKYKEKNKIKINYTEYEI
jgi:hypothetical protein